MSASAQSNFAARSDAYFRARMIELTPVRKEREAVVYPKGVASLAYYQERMEELTSGLDVREYLAGRAIEGSYGEVLSALGGPVSASIFPSEGVLAPDATGADLLAMDPAERDAIAERAARKLAFSSIPSTLQSV